MVLRKELYKNKEWLEQKYTNEELSMKYLAKVCKVDSSTIQDWLRRVKIPCRSITEAARVRALRQLNRCKLSQEELDWINGELLGDGCVYSYSNYSAAVFYGSKFLEYVKYVRDTLKSFGIEQCGKIRHRDNKEWSSSVYDYTSRRYSELLSLRKKWYPYGKKIVPRDIKLVPITLRQWFIGDGSLNKPRSKGWKPSIILCTQGFLISNVEFLKEKLIKLGFKVTRQRSVNNLRISTESTRDFLNYIGHCPVKCYEYKWNY